MLARSILVPRPHGPLEAADFSLLSSQLDTYLPLLKYEWVS